MVNFKRIAGVLALTVALSQAMTIVPVYATEQGMNQELGGIVDSTTEETVTCKHEGCNNPAESNMAPCDTCKSAYFGSIFEIISEEEHSFAYTCVCGDEFSGKEPHAREGKCICGYEATVSEEPSIGESTDSSTSEPTDSSANESTYENVDIAEEINKAIFQAMEEKVEVEEALPVTAFVSTEAVNALPAEVKSDAATDTVFNVSEITTTRGFVAAVDKIVKANAEENNVTFYSFNPFAFNTDSLTALTNANKEFVYMFWHNGQLYKITIPAGAKIDLAGQTFAGPLFIGAQLGTSVLVK